VLEDKPGAETFPEVDAKPAAAGPEDTKLSSNDQPWYLHFTEDEEQHMIIPTMIL